MAVLFGRFDRTAIELTAVTLQAFLVGLVAHALIAVLARAFYALQDTRTPVAVAVVAVVINTTLATELVEPSACPGWPWPSPSRPGSRPPCWRSCCGGAWVGSGSRPSPGLASDRARDGDRGHRGGDRPQRARSAARADPSAGGSADLLGLIGVIVIVTAAYTGVFVVAALALRIEELRSIVGIMVDALRRPRRS